MITRINAWLDPTITRNAISARFHSILMNGAPELRRLLDLFAEPEPRGSGVYNHHDGYRT